MRGLVSRFLHARGGNLATMAALVSPLFLAVAAFCVDTSSLFLERRQLQSMADFAAVAGAASISQADDAVLQQLRANGLDPVLMTGAYDPSVVDGKTDNKTRVWVEKGNYFPDKNRAVENRFVVGGASPDAVRVRLARPGNLYFGQSFIDRPALGATGMAATKAEAAFSIGSRLLSLNTDQSVLNGLLGGLLGTSLNLKLVDYNALAATDINLLGFLDKLAPKVGLTAGTYDQLLNTDVSVGMLANVLAEVVTNNATAKAALGILGKDAAALAAKLPVGKLLGLGSLANASIGSGSGYNITANVLQMVSAAVMIGGKHQVNIGSGLNVPGLLGVTLEVLVGEPPLNTPFFRVGAAGSFVRTAQIRLKLGIRVGGESGSPLIGVKLLDLNLPLAIDIASAEGELKSISCPAGPTSANVTIAAKPGIAGIYLGEISSFHDLNRKPTVSRTKIANAKLYLLGVPIDLIDLEAKAEVKLGEKTTSLSFIYSDIQSKKIKTAYSSNLVSSLSSSLLKNMEIDLNLLGIIKLPLGDVVGLVGVLLTPVAPLIDNLVFGVLDLLGVKLGEADVQVTGVLCQRAVLTQ
ncbi:TadG family pilus assembly protein [Brucella anthropi]|uniref:TadG family pilus assembly protein n=1 Tax=Brucella anthropi TaxID=529 RepID=UPI002360B552|nr:pilus assembly protein TadG-related protein [Brucella anthropi]